MKKKDKEREVKKHINQLLDQYCQFDDIRRIGKVIYQLWIEKNASDQWTPEQVMLEHRYLWLARPVEGPTELTIEGKKR